MPDWNPIPVTLALSLLGCAGAQQASVRDDFDATARPTRLPPISVRRADVSSETRASSDMPPGLDLSGELGQYVALGLSHSPTIRAAHARWEASMHRISRARRLPEPILSFGLFLRAVETRVGPQRARIGVQQTFPWPSKLSAGSNASANQARAQGARFEALSLAMAARIETAYWTLWELRRTRAIQEEHLAVIQALAQTVRARMATGAATLADQQQIDLTAARIEDGIRSMDEAERAAEARLRAAVGLGTGQTLPTTAEPIDPTLPADDASILEDLVREHPLIASYEWMAQAQLAQADAEAADRLPSFTVNADWIITGEARTPDVPGSGKDAVMAGVGVRLPLWQGNYDDSVSAARAEAISQRAEREAAVDVALAELASSLSATRDAARRNKLYAGTLLPQANSAYESVLGAYTTGRGTVAQALLAQRDLLELNVKLQQARADHMRGWARLRQIVGQDLRHAPYRGEDDGRDTADTGAQGASPGPRLREHDHGARP